MRKKQITGYFLRTHSYYGTEQAVGYSLRFIFNILVRRSWRVEDSIRVRGNGCCGHSGGIQRGCRRVGKWRQKREQGSRGRNEGEILVGYLYKELNENNVKTHAIIISPVTQDLLYHLSQRQQLVLRARL